MDQLGVSIEDKNLCGQLEEAETNVDQDTNHVGYVRQAFEGASQTIFTNILENGLLKKCMRYDEDKACISS
ncbi:unnamed protein product [Dovyalis caffra]|uniref:Uncharacterized protein n=1 Tax=Dovyalis caffra TaxID=77055 RepID=A0AAV1RTM7_9ROSI|nr:unnamed protein product [Dovyalis caffra]